MIYDSTVGAFVTPDLFSGGAPSPAIAPIGTKSKQPDFFRTKGDGPSRVAEVRSSNMRRMLSTAQVPAERAGLFADETRMKAARAADFARWQSLGSPGDFDTWVGEMYAAETGRKSLGAATRTLRTINAGMSGTDSKDYSLGSDFNQYGALVLPQMATNVASQLLGGKDREARALERYAMMRSKAPEPLGAVGTMKAVGKMAGTKEGLLTLARGMVDPDNMLMNAAALFPVAGLVGKGAGALAKGAEAASKAAVVAENAPRLASGLKMAQRAGSLAEKASSGTIANIAADASLGGTLNALQQDQNTWDDFQAGALPGAVMGLGSSVLGKVGSRIGDRIAKTADAGVRQVKLHPLQDQINLLRKEKGTLESPLPEEALTAEDLHPIAAKFLGSHKIAPENRTAVQQFVKDYGHLFVPDIAKFGGDIGHETQVVTKALDDMTKTKSAASSATPAVKDLPAKIEAARQSLPTTKEGEDVWLSSGTKKQQDDKLVKAARSYRFLREHGAIEPNPRFEGKTEVDLLAERLKQIQKETDEAKAIEATSKEQQDLKDELLEENRFRSEALRKEIDWAEKKEQTLSDINFAGTVQMKHGVPGRILDEFKSMPVEHQGIFLRDIDEMGSAGDYVRTAFEELFDDLRRIAGTSGYDPKRLRSKIEEAVDIIKKSYGKPSEGLNGTVGGSPTGRAAGTGQQAAEGVYRDVPQGQGFAPMSQAVGGQGQQVIGYSDPSASISPSATAIEGSAPGQIGYDPSRAGGQINLPDQSTGMPPIAMRDEPIGSRNELLDHQDERRQEIAAIRERQTVQKSEEEIAKILYDEILKDPSKAELFGIDRDLAIEASEPDSRFKADLKAQLVDVSKAVKAKGLPKGFF